MSTTITETQPDGSVFDAIYLAVADATGQPFETVRKALVHRAIPDDSFWAAWDEAVREATDLFQEVQA